MKLYEILIPTVDNSGDKYPLPFHKEWDTKVQSISGGLTILYTVHGRYYNTYEEMIVVRIACLPSQILLIANITLDHYNQDSVMYYEVSPNVTFVKRMKV